MHLDYNFILSQTGPGLWAGFFGAVEEALLWSKPRSVERKGGFQQGL